MIRAWSNWRAKSRRSRHCGSHGMRWERPPCPWESGATLPRPRPCWGEPPPLPPTGRSSRRPLGLQSWEYRQTALQLEMTTDEREREDLPLQHLPGFISFSRNPQTSFVLLKSISEHSVEDNSSTLFHGLVKKQTEELRTDQKSISTINERYTGRFKSNGIKENRCCFVLLYFKQLGFATIESTNCFLLLCWLKLMLLE